MKYIFFSFLLFCFFSVTHAQTLSELYTIHSHESGESCASEESFFEGFDPDMIKGILVPVGSMKCDDDTIIAKLNVTSSPSKNGFTLKFFIKNEFIGYVLGDFTYDKKSEFLGIFIREHYRGKKYSKLFIKFFILLSHKMNMPVIVNKMKKPLVAAAFFDFGFIPASVDNLVFISKKARADKRLGIFAPGIEFEEQFIESQKLFLLDEDTEESIVVPINTPYIYPEDVGLLKERLRNVSPQWHILLGR